MKRKAFTLVELLVVIAIIGILVGLLLPAVQAAREAARRMQCSNNLKQFGLAVHNYMDTYPNETLPPGYCAYGNTAEMNWTSGHSQWAWGALILPFMEQAPLHDALRITEQPAHAVNQVQIDLMKQPIEGYRCPSDVGPPTNTQDFRSLRTVNHGTTNAVATSNYVGSNNSAGLSANGNGAMKGGLSNMAADRTVRRLPDILDGTSNTLLVGERAWQIYRVSNNTYRTSRAGSAFHIRKRESAVWGSSSALGALHAKINDASNDDNARRGFSSLHPGGAQFVLCDGSVRFIAETIEHTVGGNNSDSTLERLVHCQDGQSVGEF